MRLALPALLLHGLLLSTTAHAQHSDLVETARSAGRFTTLLAAVDAAGLTSTLTGPGPYTVFAPTDEAFRKLPAGTVESLLEPGNRERLKAILLYHVVPARVSAASARTLSTARTAEGRPLRIRVDGSRLRINEATVTTADVGASNGVIHIIDQVLLPPEPAATPDRSTASREASARVLALFDLAIRRGAPLYNDGAVAATSAIYEVAARGALALGDELPAAAKRALERGLSDAARTHDEDDRAWTLRRAIDDASRRIEGRTQMSSRR
jgi:uncharacterized surface protein with fasciclin (FAS1) repeats